MNNVFGLDIGTRNVVGTVGHRTEDGAFIVEAQYVRPEFASAPETAGYES